MRQTAFIKTAYWIAAAVDGCVTLGMLFPRLLQPVLHLASVPASVETRYALGVGATLMFGWTLLLVWGSAEPIARRGVLLLTILPVIAGLALANLYGFVNDYIPRSSALYVWSLQGLLVVLLASAYRLALLRSPGKALG
jgi:hypothetical protein